MAMHQAEPRAVTGGCRERPAVPDCAKLRKRVNQLSEGARDMRPGEKAAWDRQVTEWLLTL